MSKRRKHLDTRRNWLLASYAFTVVGLYVVFGLRIGPVIATLTPSHGVHTGDFIGVASEALALTCLLIGTRSR